VNAQKDTIFTYIYNIAIQTKNKEFSDIELIIKHLWYNLEFPHDGINCYPLKDAMSKRDRIM